MAFEDVRPIFGLEDLPKGSPVDPGSVERIMQEHPGLLSRFIFMLNTVRKDPAHSTPYAVAMREELSESFIRAAYGTDPTWMEPDLEPVPWSKKLSDREEAERQEIVRRSEEFVAAHILPIANLYTIWTAFHHPELVAIPGDPVPAVPYRTDVNDVTETALQAETVEPERRPIRVVSSAFGQIPVWGPDRRPDIQEALGDLRREERRFKATRPRLRGLTVQPLVGIVMDMANRSSRLSTKWKFIGSCALVILVAAATTWIAVSFNRSDSVQAPQVPPRPEPVTEGGGQTQTATPHLQPAPGPAETPSPETPSEKAAPDPDAFRKTAAPLAPSEKQGSSRQPASPSASARKNAGPEAESSDPSDPAGVIDWLLKEYSAKHP